MTVTRLQSIRKQLRRLKANAFLCTARSNVRYLTGFTGSSGATLISEDGAWFFTDFRYKTQSAEQVHGYDIVIAKKGLIAAAGALAQKRKFKRVAFEAGHVTVEGLGEAQKKFKRAKLVPSTSIIEKLRLQKDEEEIAALRKAVEIADGGYDFIIGKIEAGRTEREVAFDLERYMLDIGAEALAFNIIVASGARSAMPHGAATDKTIQKGDLVTLDFGAIYKGYCSDITRTVCVGKPTREQQKVYSTVRSAQKKAEERIRPGMACRAADKIARDYIDSQGHKEHFGHGLGHGVGLDIHESPRLSPTGKGKLQANNTVTVEPGIYIEGWGGIRIEDLAVVRDKGLEVLTRAPNPPKIPVV